MNQVFFRFAEMPDDVNGFTSMDSHEDYNIVINKALPHPVRQAVMMHELTHIFREDFHNDLTLEEAEGKKGSPIHVW